MDVQEIMARHQMNQGAENAAVIPRSTPLQGIILFRIELRSLE